jgi:hypothetical protein
MKHVRPPHPRRRPRGQALMEYVIVCVALALALFVPVPGDTGPQGPRTTVQILLDAFGSAYARFSHAVSLPN